jgi:hypothetical protein
MIKLRYWIYKLWYKYKSWRFERKCIKYLGMKPQKMYVTKEQYDALVEAINRPPDPKVVERFKEIMNKKAPWDDDYESSK